MKERSQDSLNVKTLPLLSVLAISLLPHCLSEQEVTGNILFKNVPPQKVLSTYEQLSGLELIIFSNVRDVLSGIDLETNSISRSDAIAAIEKALQRQAGIVITRLDEKRASVTYNDALLGANQSQLCFRVIKLDPNGIASRLKDATESKENRSTGELLLAYLRQRGITFSPPESYFYSNGKGTLVLRASPGKLEKTELALSELNQRK